MKKLVNKIFLIPILFLLFSLILFGIFYFYFIEDVSNAEFKKLENLIIKNEKRVLKINVDSILTGVDEIRVVGYDTSEMILKDVLHEVLKNYKQFKRNEKQFLISHMDKNMFFYIASKNFVYPLIYQTFIKVRNKRFLITVYNGKKYLSFETRYKGKIFGIAYKLSLVDDLIKDEIVKYIASLSRGDDYIAIGKITNWYAKNGVFGEIVYHPIKKLIGKKLVLDKPDIKGNYYRRKYFNCLKVKDFCFEEYYFLNPKTHKYEKKLSYFRIYRPYNFVFVKGIYFSDIVKELEKIRKEVLKDFQKLFIVTLYLLLFFVFIGFTVSYLISKKIMKMILDEYEWLKKELYQRIYYDKVTNLPNKFMLLDKIDDYKSLVILDIEDFANINNLYGFEFGDKVLVCIRDFLKSRFKDVYKIGSDEFAIPFKTSLNEKMLKKISSLTVECEEVEVSFVVGGSEIKDLFITAESSLKLAQKQHLKYLLYNEQFKLMQKEKFEQVVKLRKALANGDIIPYYQPIVDKEGNITKYEALMRVKIDDKIVSPFMFMDLIKEAKLYDEFSKLMIKKVFEDAKSDKLHKVSLNLSFLDISNAEIREFILDLLQKSQIGEKITFEILESESLENINIVTEFIKKVKEFGVTIAIDDFGSGYSNFVNILTIKPDFIKIDGSLIKNIQKPEYYEIVKLINNFAKKFDILTVAEFVENREIFDILIEIGIDCFQGYYFYKPMPFDKIS